MNTSALPAVPTDATSLPGDVATRWRLIVLATNEPLLLPRVLQKLAVPEIELWAAHYTVGPTGDAARVELLFATRAARARLAEARVGKIIGLREVVLERAQRNF